MPKGAEDERLMEGARWALAVSWGGGGEAANATPEVGNERVAQGHRESCCAQLQRESKPFLPAAEVRGVTRRPASPGFHGHRESKEAKGWGQGSPGDTRPWGLTPENTTESCEAKSRGATHEGMGKLQDPIRYGCSP